MDTAKLIVEEAKKREIALRYFLLGKGYHRALRAMNFNQKLFAGTRKDGITPEFDHHICQVQYLRTLPDVLFPEATAATIFFHDTPEDKGIAIEEIRRTYEDDPAFGNQVAEASWRMTKKFRGEQRSLPELFSEMARCPISSIGKGCDRIHNVLTMVGVFSVEKQRRYLEEVDQLFLPMLKQAERNFPEQEAAYKNIRMMLKSQSAIIRGTLAAAQQGS